ncbi:MAG TPA: BMP family ABC transporter substrate-binding protein [Myxococcales bacterium]|nr:BMP family ABC transporter substrate-binding protein [Myxococcales bacterium]
MKRLLKPAARAACWLLLASAVAGCKKTHVPHTVGLALDVGGRGDQSFNDGALRGLEQMAAGLKYTARGYEPIPGATSLGIPPPLVLSGKAQEDYEPNLQLLVDQGSELVIAVGFMMEPAVRAVAARNPGAKFLLLDSPVLDAAGKPSVLPNVRAVVFRENEGAFLTGALAGALTKTGKIAFVGGIQVPLIRKFEAGYRAGARQVNPKVEVLVAYTGSFDDEKKGIETGQDLYGRGCDIIFHGAGLDGLGVIKSAQQAGKLVIGVDSDQSHVAPHNVLTSMVKRVDLAVYGAVKDVLAGSFTGGDVALGLKEDGVGLLPVGSEVSLEPAKKTAAEAEVARLRGELIAGRIVAPATLDELAKFKP